jgi:hypothetical protein
MGMQAPPVWRPWGEQEALQEELALQVAALPERAAPKAVLLPEA